MNVVWQREGAKVSDKNPRLRRQMEPPPRPRLNQQHSPCEVSVYRHGAIAPQWISEGANLYVRLFKPSGQSRDNLVMMSMWCLFRKGGSAEQWATRTWAIGESLQLHRGQGVWRSKTQFTIPGGRRQTCALGECARIHIFSAEVSLCGQVCVIKQTVVSIREGMSNTCACVRVGHWKNNPPSLVYKEQTKCKTFGIWYEKSCSWFAACWGLWERLAGNW